MRVGLGDAATFATIVTVAVVEVLNETLKLDPEVRAAMPSFLTSTVWHFVPAALLAFAGLLWIAKHLGWIGKAKPLETSRNRNYRDEVVAVDGMNFVNCTFHNATFRYNGGAFNFSNAVVTGTWRFETQNISALGAVEILKIVGGLNPEFARNWNPRLPAEYFH